MNIIEFSFNLKSEIRRGLSDEKYFLPLLLVCLHNLWTFVYMSYLLCYQPNISGEGIAMGLFTSALLGYVFFVAPLWLFLKRREIVWFPEAKSNHYLDYFLSVAFSFLGSVGWTLGMCFKLYKDYLL